ncbi:MAG TPA: hypothetical protein PLO41_08020 [Rubrivivax sp.]|nr:hypothetical protein [Rubrivivax sp.]
MDHVGAVREELRPGAQQLAPLVVEAGAVVRGADAVAFAVRQARLDHVGPCRAGVVRPRAEGGSAKPVHGGVLPHARTARAHAQDEPATVRMIAVASDKNLTRGQQLNRSGPAA